MSSLKIIANDKKYTNYKVFIKPGACISHNNINLLGNKVSPTDISNKNRINWCPNNIEKEDIYSFMDTFVRKKNKNYSSNDYIIKENRIDEKDCVKLCLAHPKCKSYVVDLNTSDPNANCTLYKNHILDHNTVRKENNIIGIKM